MEESLFVKQEQFNAAMERYTQKKIYPWVGHGVSVIIVSLQVVLGGLVFQMALGGWAHLVTVIVAFVLADLVNGWVHLVMDNHADYTSLVGPLVANFHLHHRTPVYKSKPLARVYFDESGSKLWLAVVLIGAVLGVSQGMVTGAVAYGVFYFAVFSSVAEVSHYLCHVPLSRTARLFTRLGLLMSKRHHVHHHLEDNVNYAFLSGWSDPLLNAIARAFYRGYKNTTDLHFARYAGPGSENRQGATRRNA